jgi:3-hydroxyacyl-CoA dehydrogenase
MNRERVLSDAKARARTGARRIRATRAAHRHSRARRKSSGRAQDGRHIMRQGDFITDYEVKLGNKIAEVLCGGNVTPGTPVSEQYILDLEREAFKSLCGEKKTQERIQYTLKTGKTLRKSRDEQPPATERPDFK